MPQGVLQIYPTILSIGILIQFFMCPEFWVHIKNAFAVYFNFFVIPLYRADGCSGTVSLIAVVIHAWHQEKET